MASLKSVHPRAALRFPLEDPEWRRKMACGGLWMLLPPIGWPAALGYRGALIDRLHGGSRPLLPEWRGKLRAHWTQGMRAIGVMHAYYAPVYAALILGASLRGAPDLPWLALAATAVLATFLSPFVGPVVALGGSPWFGGTTFTAPETAAMLAGFAIATFLLPAGYLQVSRTGRFRSALRLDRSLALVRSEPRTYVEAWLASSVLALPAHFAGVFAPWTVFWCYQSIVFLFNETLTGSDAPEDQRFQCPESWLVRLTLTERTPVAPGARRDAA